MLCLDDPAVTSILPSVSRPITTYGLSEGAQVRAVDVRAVGTRMHFNVVRSNGVTLPSLKIDLNLPGIHNVRNALAAIAIAVELNIPDEAVQAALQNFSGVGRRFQNHGPVLAKGGGHFTLIEDYGHHPVELRATIEAARGAFPKSRLLLAFQPHRYTRTRDCFEDFVRVLQLADWVCLTQVYAAGEAPIVAADSRALMRSLRIQGFEQVALAQSLEDISDFMLSLAKEGDVVMCLGAGSIGQVPGLMKASAAISAKEAV